MTLLVPSSWHVVLRVTICFLVFYAVLFFLISFVYGMSLMQLIYGHALGVTDSASDPAAVIWLKFCGDVAARLGAAVLLVQLGVPRYRFALLQDGTLKTNFTSIFPRWIAPMFALAIATALGMLVPVLTQHILIWLLFHALFTYAMMHYMMHGVKDAYKLRMVEA